MSEYTSSDGFVSFDLAAHPHHAGMTYEAFNRIMETRGCPVRADSESSIPLCILAAWDWLTHELQMRRMA